METRLYQVAYVPPQQTALASDVGEEETTISVDDASAISPTDTTDYYLYVQGEFMALESTDETNDTATVTRGVLGTAAKPHEQGQAVYAGVIDADGTDSRELRHIDEIPNPEIKEIGEIEQNLEYEQAKFRISNCKVTLRNLPKDRLRDTGSVHRPWVFEVEEGDGTVIFSGIIDGESVSYTASTRTTSFDVLSWLELLDRAGSVPARDVFEVDIEGTKKTSAEDSYVSYTFADIQIKLNNEASLAGNVAQVGDVAVFDTDETEIRKQVVEQFVDDDDRVIILINAKEQGEDDSKTIRKVPAGGGYRSNMDATRLGRDGAEFKFRLKNNEDVFDIVDTLGGDLSEIPKGEGKWIDVPEGFGVDVEVKYDIIARDAAGNVTDRESRVGKFGGGDQIRVVATGGGYEIVMSRAWSVIDDNTPSGFVVDPDALDNMEYRVRIERDSTQRIIDSLSADDTVRILGQEIYGYNGVTYGGQVSHYEATDLVKNLFQIKAAGNTGRAQLGVLPEVFDAAAFENVNTVTNAEALDPRVEYPDDPLKSLRQIQQRRQFLLQERFTKRTNSDGEVIPGYYTEFVFRDSFFNTAAEVSERRVKEWTESVSENDVRAVIVKPNEDYLTGVAGPDVDQRIGFYFDGIKRYEQGGTEDLRQRMTPPEGRNVIEIEMPILPSPNIGYKYWGGDTVENNPKLKRVAKFFYDHFSNASREVEITFGNDDPEWIGGYWYFKDQGEVIDDFVFVTRETKSVDTNSIDTSLKGRISEEDATIVDAPPTAIVKGPKEISRADSAGDVKVVLNGDDSFSVSGNTIEYTWDRKKAGGTYSEVQSNGPILKDTISGVDSQQAYVYRLTVTDKKTGATDSTEHELNVAPALVEANPRPRSEDFDVKTWQQDKDGILEVIPEQFYSLQKVESRSKVGGNIDKGQSFSEVSRLQVGIASIDTTNNEVVLTGDYEEHFDKPLLYLKDNNQGGTSQFKISSTSYDSGADQTTVALSESIGSTRFDAAETGTYVTRVDLSNKHTSAIEVRVTGDVGGNRVTQLHTFDFDALAEVDASVYNDESGAVYADVSGDEDTDTFDLEYRINDGSWQTKLTGQATDIVGYEVVQASNVSDGDTVEVRITPYNFDGEKGQVVTRATFYNRSTGGGASFDALTINQAGTIDNIKDGEFRFLNTDGSDNAKIDVFGLEVDKINGTSVSEFASQSDVELLAKNIVQTEAEIDALDAVTVRRSREFIAGNAIGPLGDLSEDRTVTVQEEDLAGTFLAPNGSGALAVQTTGDLVGDGSGKMQIGQSVVQTREIDESIAPTWTGVHTHAADIEMQSQQVRFNDGVLQGDGNGALEVLKADESNQGTLRVDEIVAHTVTVVDEIDQRNVNDLRVEDQYIVVNENQSGTPGLDGGLVAERGGLEDAYIEWEEGLDVWGTRLENGTLKPITLRDTSMADTGIPYWNQQEERIETDSDLKFLADQSQPFEEDPAGKVQTKAGIGHPDYLTEKQHWYITPGGLGDFRTLLSDELRVEAFIAEVEEALAGSDFLTKSFATLDAAFDVPSSSPVGTQKDLTVQDLDGLGATPVFGNDTSQQDDTLRLRITDRSGGGLTVADIWLRCLAGSYTDNGDGTQTWTVEILQAGDAGIGAGLTAPEGSVVLDYGVPGDFLIERSVLNPDSGDIAPYDRMLSWKDNDGDRIPDDYEVLNLRGRLDGLSKAYASGFGTYTETARFTSDIIVGDIEAGAAGDQTGSYLRFSDNDGLEVVYGDGFGGTNDGRLSSAVLQLEDDVRLLAEEIVQEQESRAGLEITASETEARVRAQAEIIGDDFSSDATISAFADETKSRFESSVQYTKDGEVEGEAKINLEAGPNGSSAVLAAEDVRISGNTTFFGGSGIPGGVLEDDYTEKGTENVTIRGSGEPNSTTTRGFDSDGDGTNDDPIDGDFYIDTSDGDKPYVYDGPKDKWFAAYTSINGGDIETGTVNLDRLSFANAEEGYIDAQYLNITASDLTINSNTTFFGSEYPNASGIPGDALQGDYTSIGDESQTFRQSSPAPTNDDANGRDLQKGDVWIDTSDGNAPHVYTGSNWEPSNTDIPGSFLSDDYTVAGNESQTFRQPSPAPTDSDANGRDLQTGDIWIDTSDGNNPHVYDGPNDQWEAAYTNIDGGNINTNTVALNRLSFRNDQGEIKADALGITVNDLDIDATDVTISGSFKSDVKNAVLQLEDDVRLLAENLTQEQEARAGLELTASETEARFEADVKFAGNTAAITLLANDDGSSARLAGDSITLDGDTIITGSLTMDNTNDPNGEITNSAGEFTLDEDGLSLEYGNQEPNEISFYQSGTKKAYINLYENNLFGNEVMVLDAKNNTGIYMEADNNISARAEAFHFIPRGGSGTVGFGVYDEVRVETSYSDSGNTTQEKQVLAFDNFADRIYTEHPRPRAGEGIIYLYNNGGEDIELYAATTNDDGTNWNKNKIAGG